MPLMVHVTKQELCDLFHTLGIWDKIERQECTLEYITSTQAPARSYPNAMSTIARVRNAVGFQIGTAHLILAVSTREVLHRDASDLVVGDVKLERQKASAH